MAAVIQQQQQRKFPYFSMEVSQSWQESLFSETMLSLYRITWLT